jgi:hypothetical protein
MSVQPLEPDREQIEIFVDAIFRHAAAQGFVSIRSFYEEDDKPFGITAAQFHGERRLVHLVDLAENNARTAAQAAKAVVFAPPLAIFNNRDKAREADILEGLVLSVECDEHPQQARQTLEQLLGRPTVAVRSGGIWINGGAAAEDKLHLHWRLAIPASGKDGLAKLKRARALATKLVRGDASNKPVCHPIRWPGSWHRKAEPRLCAIETLNADTEIDLDSALKKLSAAMREEPEPEEPEPEEPGPEEPGEDDDSDDKLVVDIISGQRFHVPLTRLAARYVGRGMIDSQCVKLLRSLMKASIAPRNERWQTRYAAILRYVREAREKFGAPTRPTVHIEERDAGEDIGHPPPREWLLANQFCRKFLSSLIAPGGIGKSSLRLLQLLSLATGKPYSGQHVLHRSRVLTLSFEDDIDEAWRRKDAACIHHKIDRSELKGWFFYACPKGLKLAEMVQGKRQIGALEKELRDAIGRRKPDIIALDPFVKLHELEENDNGAMDFVCDLLAQLAIEFNIAVDVPHHTRKGSSEPGDPDAGRGASGIRDAGRLIHSLMPMSETEAQAFGISAEDRHDYVRLDPAKTNLIRRSHKTTWFRLISVPLGNGTPDYPMGDHIQTIEPWSPPDIWANLSSVTLNAVLTEIDKGMPNGHRYSDSATATTRAAWPVVMKHCPNITESQARMIIRTWKQTKVLFPEKYDDPVERKERTGLKVDDTKRPS